MEKLYTVSKTRPGADCGSDHELLIAKFRLKLKKVGKTSRPFRYDLYQIPYDYTGYDQASFIPFISSDISLKDRRGKSQGEKNDWGEK